MKYILQSKIQYKILILVLKIYSIYFSKIYRMKKNIVVKFCELIGYIKTSWKCLVNIWSKLPCFWVMTFKASQLPSNLQSIACLRTIILQVCSLQLSLGVLPFSIELVWVQILVMASIIMLFVFALSLSLCVCVWIYHFHCILLPVVEQGQEH